jgi:hypothetical protein
VGLKWPGRCATRSPLEWRCRGAQGGNSNHGAGGRLGSDLKQRLKERGLPHDPASRIAMPKPDRELWLEACRAELRKRRPRMRLDICHTVSDSLWLVRGLFNQDPAEAVREWAEELGRPEA